MGCNASFYKVISFSFIAALFFGVLIGVAKAERYALLIGVATYGDRSGITQLPSNLNDVEALRKALISNAEYPAVGHVFVMTTNLPKESEYFPSSDNIKLILKRLRGQLKQQDSLLVYFSCHGVSEQGKQYLLGANANINDVQGTSLAVETLHEYLYAIPAGQLVTILDTCRNDPSSPPLPAAEVKDATKELYKGLDVKAYEILNNTKAPARMEIFACSDGERSWVDKARGTSVFTYFLVEGIKKNAGNRDGPLAGENLFVYAREKVKKHAADKPYRQTPYRLIGGSEPIVIADKIRSFAPAKLEFKGLDPDVTYEIYPDKYDRNTHDYALEDNTEQIKITLEKPGFKPQVLPSVMLTTETTQSVTPTVWEEDLQRRISLIMPKTPDGFKWGKLEFGSDVYSQEKDTNGNPVRIRGETIHGQKLDVRQKNMEVWLSNNTVSFNLTITDKQNVVKHLVGGSVTLLGGRVYEIKFAPDYSLSAKPIEAVILNTSTELATQYFVVPAGTDYHVSHVGRDVKITVNGSHLPSFPSGSRIPLDMGFDSEKDFWILYLKDGRVRRRTRRVTKQDSEKKILTGEPSILDVPRFDSDPKTLLDFSKLPVGMKAIVTVEGKKHRIDSLDSRQLVLDLESNSAEATISIEHSDFDPTPFTVNLTSGSPLTLTKEIEQRRIGSALLKFSSDVPGQLSIVRITGGTVQDQPASDTIKAMPGTDVKVLLSQPGCYQSEMAVTVVRGENVKSVHMERHSLKTPDDVWVTNNRDRAHAAMIFIPAGKYKIGMPTPDPEHELAQGEVGGGYWIYAYPVTVGQYYMFRNGKNPPRGINSKDWSATSQLPMTHITNAEAREYAKWAGGDLVGDLPTEQEWEAAARGVEGYIYPWKDKWSSQAAKALRYESDKPVGSKPENHSPLGVADIWGHVREWTSSDGGSIVRGSSFKSPNSEKPARLTWRSKVDPAGRPDDVGFRVVIREPTVP